MDTTQGPLLVVEDVPDTRNLVELTLKFKGYRVVTATNGSGEWLDTQSACVVTGDVEKAFYLIRAVEQ